MGMGLDPIASRFDPTEAQAAGPEGQSLSRRYLTHLTQLGLRVKA
jgi:hypothetical protein